MDSMSMRVFRRPSSILWSEIDKWAPDSALLRLGELPAGWRLLRVGDFATQLDNREKVTPEGAYRMAGVRWYGEGVFYRETVRGRDQSASYLFPLVPGAIIYNRLFAWKESFAVVPNALDGGYVSNEFPQFHIDPKVALAEYLYLLFGTKKIIEAVNAASVGSAAVSRNRFKESEFLSFRVPVPPLNVQRKIVAYWNLENSKASAKVVESQELTNRAPSLLARSVGLESLDAAHGRRAFVSQWRSTERWGVDVAREISRRPDIEMGGFPVVSLSDVILDLQNGWSPKCLSRPAEDDEWGVLKLGAVSFGWFDARQNKALPKNLAPREQYEVLPGDLIISRANIARYVGACALVGEVRRKLMLCDKLFRVIFKLDSPILPKYLNEILKIPHLRWQIENNLTGASPTMKNISKPALLGLKFPLPPLGVQSEIISEIEKMRGAARILREDAEVGRGQAKLNIEKMALGLSSME
ncbi:hypothetical protein MOQ17_16180 [Stenotrophomonas maltophilia]|uniref:hypothetical protein n=1 Tax=Stenotrophomonas geniculata TaxID=86188 RepID=UPI001F52EBD6|nr:hypothetical protein [Stenotrophomonas maltophilia]MCI1108538.1 hypothetical protein [Stenotrophomonas maltophilia]